MGVFTHGGQGHCQSSDEFLDPSCRKKSTYPTIKRNLDAKHARAVHTLRVPANDTP